MKKVISIIIALTVVFILAACSNNQAPSNNLSESIDNTELSTESNLETEGEGGKVLVVYYSTRGNTENVANYIIQATGADDFKLEPVEAYSNADLNYNDDGSRVVYEYNNPDARNVELVENTVPDWESYDTVFIGYPIWWGIAAWPVNDFIMSNDFTGKTIVPFATSASSGFGESGELLTEMAETGNWLEGERFSSSVSEENVVNWVNSLEIKK